MFQAFSLSWGDAPRFDVAGLQPVGDSKMGSATRLRKACKEPERLIHYNLRRRLKL